MARSLINVTSDVDFHGPLLKGTGEPILREFNRKAKEVVTRTGEEEVRRRLGRRVKHPTGSFSRSIMTKDYKQGRTITADYPQILYGPWLEGTSTRNASTRFKGYRMFRQTRAWLRKNVDHLVQHLLDEAVRKLNA